MDRIRSAIKTKIHVESEQLVMCGHPSESSGCVLRGVLDVRVKEPTKVKGITLQFSGKMTITWTERKYTQRPFTAPDPTIKTCF